MFESIHWDAYPFMTRAEILVSFHVPKSIQNDWYPSNRKANICRKLNISNNKCQMSCVILVISNYGHISQKAPPIVGPQIYMKFPTSFSFPHQNLPRYRSIVSLPRLVYPQQFQDALQVLDVLLVTLMTMLDSWVVGVDM